MQGELMRFNWLESKTASILFFCSAVAFLSVCALTFSIALPGIQHFLNSSSTNQFFAILFFAAAALAIPSILLIFFGMAIYCAYMDDRSIGTKALWFALFLTTGPIGSTAYYFTVYRRHIQRIRAAGSGWPGLEGSI
jgi:hypothetical protein